ncbi:IS66 family insertion sequence element accessory protein TnpA [Dysgonomonas termitidis]|uniref:IS66 family insertion sequence element accessory protein TnpB n=1 Tax=Dysgonomonas termitidis TaxID=1516126 RepID=A0ABV9KQV3_9BACT
MAKYMTREEFAVILLRQRQSSLTVTDFCRNEGYNRSQFYDWRLRFRITDEELEATPGCRGMAGFAPISIDNGILSPIHPGPAPLPGKPEKQCTKGSDDSEISLELPNGIKMKFKGPNGCKAALSLITKLCGSCSA